MSGPARTRTSAAVNGRWKSRSRVRFSTPAVMGEPRAKFRNPACRASISAISPAAAKYSRESIAGGGPEVGPDADVLQNLRRHHEVGERLLFQVLERRPRPRERPERFQEEDRVGVLVRPNLLELSA